MQVVDCGTTEIPEEVFDEYLSDLKEEYTATKYHLLNFNCNSFTQDVSCSPVTRADWWYLMKGSVGTGDRILDRRQDT
jgi:hypothetical protein